MSRSSESNIRRNGKGDSLYDGNLGDLLFFFQAEDGIRDYKVTGVQTCALPISPLAPRPFQPLRAIAFSPDNLTLATGGDRSEEGRVGGECRFRWAPDYLKKKNQKNAKSSCCTWLCIESLACLHTIV